MIERQHIAALDGLRGLAAYTVLISHFSNQTNLFGGMMGYGGGQVGVMLFFVLSGFLMGRLYLVEAISPAAVSDFYRKRVARVFPLYLLIVIGSYVLTKLGHPWPFYVIDDGLLWRHLLFWQGSGILWTVPVEVQFYAAFPLIWLAYRLVGRALLPLLVAAVSLASQGWLLSPYVPYFLMGLIVSILPAMRLRGINIVFLALLPCYVLSFPMIARAIGLWSGGFWESPFYLLLIPAMLAATINAPVAETILGNKVAKVFGDISYSAYLLHIPVLTVLTQAFGGTNVFVFLAVFLTVTTAVSHLSHRFIERPARKLIAGGKLDIQFSLGKDHSRIAANRSQNR